MELLEAKVELPGVNISIVDEEPKERLLISVYKIDVDFKQRVTTKKPHFTTD